MSRAIPAIPDSRRGDEAVLQMLQLRDQKLTVSQIAARLGLTKGTVSGWLFRIDRETEKHEVAA